MPKPIKSSTPFQKGDGNAISRKPTMKQSSTYGDQYIIDTPIDEGEYASAPFSIQGIANAQAQGIPGVTRAELTESIEVACENKRQQIESLPVPIRGSLLPTTKK
jgi:hypothetical protein